MYLIFPLIIVRLLWLSLHEPEYRQRWRERIGLPGNLENFSACIWVHAVSVGEVQAAKPLVDALLAQDPGRKILITTLTPTGAARVRQCFGALVRHLYMPYDLPVSVRSLIRRIKPRLLIVMETELWPNLFHYCRAENIPIVWANARMSEKSANGYRWLPSLTHATLSDLSMIIAQGQADAERLIALGADGAKVFVTGNLKFDMDIPHNLTEQAQALKQYFSTERPIWIAASTHEGEENIVLDAYQTVLQQYAQCLLVIAPRHPKRAAVIASLCKKRNFRVLRKSEEKPCGDQIQIFILDSFGELPRYYATADMAFVGGSLVKVGGHNLLEPAGLGLPVIMGPHVFNFKEISQLLLDGGAAWQVDNASELADVIIRLLKDKALQQRAGNAGENIILKHRGNTNRVLKLIKDNFLSAATSES